MVIDLQNELNKLETLRSNLSAAREQTASDLDQAKTRLATQGVVTRAINDVSALQSRLAALDVALLEMVPQIDAKRAEIAIAHTQVEREQRSARLAEIAAARLASIEDYYGAASAASAALQREVENMRSAVGRYRDLGQEGRTLWQHDNDRIPSDHPATMTDMPGREVEHGFAITTAYRTIEKNLSDAALKRTNDEREVILAAQREKYATPPPQQQQQQQEPAPPSAPWLTNGVQGWVSRS
jgi:DNA repair exonuclease SbcCD ATPase subunit